VLKDGLNLFARDAGKPLQKFLHSRSAFQIDEQGGHRNARSSKDPGAADTFSALFYFIAHIIRVSAGSTPFPARPFPRVPPH
jgi:hypothetical protein